jgi:hypothetical protein
MASDLVKASLAARSGSGQSTLSSQPVAPTPKAIAPRRKTVLNGRRPNQRVKRVSLEEVIVRRFLGYTRLIFTPLSSL